MMRLQGKIAIVTGAGQGIGAAIARRFSLEGARVVLAELNETQGALMAADIEEETNNPVLFVPTDVADPDSVQNMYLVTKST
ncbi:MAG: SDR family NAD(P)-dependent oxidoreductase, partial [Halocynthiibacter sp.]